ncbi:MAG: MFS transporter [Chloroflexota bacterium]|nr:MFS transporter [Chloroflexota bacterium]
MQQTPTAGRRSGSSGSRIPSAFRYPAFRAYWTGMLCAVTGFQMFRVAQSWLVYELTGSPLYLGYALAANAIPGIVFNLIGGVFADRLDKRVLVFSTQCSTGLFILVMGLLTLLGVVEVWHILVIAFLAGAAEAFDTPARQALYPHLIERSAMTSAVALNSSIWQGTRIVAPAIAGFIIDLVNTGTALVVSAVGFFIMAGVMLFLHIPPIPSGAPRNPARALWEGMAFIGKNSIFAFLIAMTFFNSFFGMAYVLLMPVFAVDVLEVGGRGLGILLGVGGVGSLATTIWLGARGGLEHRGIAILGGAAIFGLGIVAFGLTSQFLGNYALALALMAILGCSNSIYMISIQSSLQMLVPDSVRGRVMGFYGMTYSIMPLGGLQAGALASVSWIGAPIAVSIGGAAVVLFALGTGAFNRKIRQLGSQAMTEC